MSPLPERPEEGSGTSFWVRPARFTAGHSEPARVPVFSFFEELFRARQLDAVSERQKISAG
ncbi:hypothetical protein [Anaeromyxobacter paludicola]|uniref:Uncharacterized protein n=1 Tax=Anaeromyxobacter paludicola TaxID=2918171 RepID=A0ABN6N3R0_9BACT|nr:hypothetical protein [Anaeromyxobacter paludicola]BDG07809.1 hypothetical protein AMPC_09220 [Anaeromyxobacter paludicola]